MFVLAVKAFTNKSVVHCVDLSVHDEKYKHQTLQPLFHQMTFNYIVAYMLIISKANSYFQWNIKQTLKKRIMKYEDSDIFQEAQATFSTLRVKWLHQYEPLLKVQELHTVYK